MIKHRLLVAVFASMALTGWSGDTEIIVESAPDGLNFQAFSTEGRWADSAGKSTAPGLKGTSAKYNDANDEAGTARFTPDIPTAGKYEVFMTYPVQGNAEGVKYKVVSSDGEKELVLTQFGRQDGSEPTANEWYSMGTFNFAAGKSGYVEVSDPLTGVKPHAADNGRIYADAFKFVPVGFALPADYVNRGGSGASAAPVAATPAAVADATAPVAETGTAASLPGLPDAAKPAPSAPAGLPALPEAPAPAAGLPALPASTGAAAALPGLPAGNAAANLPSLAPVAPTPRHNIPTPADTPAPVAPGMSASTPNLPSLPMANAPQGQTLPAGIPPTSVQPTAPSASVTPASGPSISQYNPSGLQWMFDYGAGLKSARDQGKKVMVFFTAYGNTSAEKYETEYFQHPTVRQALSQYVLVKVDFPRNTRLGYSLGVFGAGTIVVTDAIGNVTARVEQLPPTPTDLVRLMAATRPTRAAVTAAQAEKATSGTAESTGSLEMPAMPAVPEAPAAPDANAAMPAMPQIPTAPAAPAVPPVPPVPGAPPVPTPPAM